MAICAVCGNDPCTCNPTVPVEPETTTTETADTQAAPTEEVSAEPTAEKTEDQ